MGEDGTIDKRRCDLASSTLQTYNMGKQKGSFVLRALEDTILGNNKLKQKRLLRMQKREKSSQWSRVIWGYLNSLSVNCGRKGRLGWIRIFCKAAFLHAGGGRGWWRVCRIFWVLKCRWRVWGLGGWGVAAFIRSIGRGGLISPPVYSNFCCI